MDHGVGTETKLVEFDVVVRAERGNQVGAVQYWAEATVHARQSTVNSAEGNSTISGLFSLRFSPSVLV